MSIFTPQAYLGGPPTSPTPPPTWLPSNNPSLAGWYDASDMSSHINSGGAIVGLESQDIYGDDLGAIGNHYAVGLFYPQDVGNVKDSIWSMKGTRDYDISAQMSNQWRGEIDLGNGVAANGSLGSFSTNRENQWIIV